MNPKRLIEVDLPIKRISAHARREKSIRHGHISTLHIWWARRPLAACRAVICAALWPDPADPECPQEFRDAAASVMNEFARKVTSGPELLQGCSEASYGRWTAISRFKGGLEPENPVHWNVIRGSLLDFIADFANWDNATKPAYLEAARALTRAAHEALGGEPGTRPLVVDPFAGGGAIPLEALRVGADAFASDLNPVAVLLNKVVLEYIPRYGQQLADEVRKWGQWIKEEAEKELAEFYPRDPDGATPIAYLWARTVRCEGPVCGAEVPLIRSLWLAKRPKNAVALKITSNPAEKRVDFEILRDAREKDVGEGTVARGSAACPCCGYTTPVASVRRQLKERRGGATDARLLCVVTTRTGEQGRFYRLPTAADLEAVKNAAEELERRKRKHTGPLSLVPNELISLNEIRRITVPLYGMLRWGDLFATRQTLTLSTFARLVGDLESAWSKPPDAKYVLAVQTLLAFAVSKQADFNSSLARWANHMEKSVATFGRQAVPMLWDWAEICPLGSATGGFSVAVDWIADATWAKDGSGWSTLNGLVQQLSATNHSLADETAQVVITDPPYYDAIPYAHLSDFFYVWLKRSLHGRYPELLGDEQVPKLEEIVVDRPHELSSSTKDVATYERELTRAFAESRRVLKPDGRAVIVFASKTTASWEAILQAVVSAGWIISGSWPIDTEREARIAAIGQARLASSIHLVCRPRPSTHTPTLSHSHTVVGD